MTRAEALVLVCSNDFSRCSRVMALAITRAISGCSACWVWDCWCDRLSRYYEHSRTGAIASDGHYLTVAFFLVCSNDFSRCSRVMADAITRAIGECSACWVGYCWCDRLRWA
ncbi:hypothetical protein NG799_20685 [Laspinema sp. D1]|uniref:Secreted protein n=2 Tax=Laspinema TaxID=2584823 RepID=A0ABT2MVF6_9CYAN|nr:hypothetical protein [Laspinema sp. D2a]